MADEYGLELVIPDGFIEKLQKADDELELTAMQAEDTKERVIKAFKEMGDQGVDYFLKKLNEMQKALGNISTKNITLKGLESSAKGAAKAADDMVRVADAFGQISQESPRADGGLKNIDEVMVRMMNDIKATREELSLYDEFLKKNVIGLNEYNAGITDTADRLDALMRGYEALAQARISLSQEDGTNLEVEKKEQELQRLNEAYRQGTSELQKKAKIQEEESKEYKKARDNEEKANEARKKAELEYTKLFDKAIEKQERLNRLKEEEQRKTYQGAMSYSSNAKNMLEDANAIKYLEAARAKLDRTDSDYTIKLKTLNNAIIQHKKNIATAKGESVTFERQQRSLINTADQLKRKLALVFSVSAITGYFKKMVEVRGEFELQKVALTAILQNKEKADELWAKTQELALQSPFKLQQLVTFTKQLAAYQVEADKLYDTNKRLADVSAGLGVEMNRLILAFGQVKAANYLRSAEIRQFTEAGINMLGELSKLYTEIEGKMVSVGEVQARVQKRLVSFADVEEVFKRMTDAGGMFYNMQEKQAETLKGMIAKLGDALDIMLNKVGEANEGVLKGAVQATLNLLQNWQKIGDVVLPILGAIIARMMILKAPDLFKALILQLGVLTDSLKLAFYQATRNKQAFDALSASAKAASTAFKGWAAVIAIVIAAAWGLVRVYQAAKKEQDAINKIAADAGNNARILAAKYESLVKIVQDQTKSYQEQKSAIDELKRTYGDILPAEMLEIDNIRTMGQEYTKARDAIYSYIEAKAKQKQIDVIESNEGEKLRSIESNIIDGLTKGLRDVLGKENVQRADISAIITDVLQKQREGIINNASQAQYYIRKAIKEAYEIEFESSEQAIQALSEYFRATGHNFSQDIQMLILRGQQYNDAIEETMTKSVSTLNAGLRKLEAARQKWESADENRKIREAFENTQNWQFLTDRQKKEIIEDLSAFYEKMNEAMPDWSEVVNDPLRFDEETRRFNQMWLRSMVEDLDKQFTKVERNAQGSEQVLKSTWDKFKQDVETKINTQNLEDWQNLIISGIYQFADANKISLEGMNSIVLRAGQTMKDYFAGIEGDIDNLKQEIGQEGLNKINFPEAWTADKQKGLENMEQQLALYEYIMSLYYDAKQADKESDKADREALNLLKERVKLVQEMNKEYEKNKEYLSEEAAWEKVIESYEKHFNELFAGTGIRLKKAILNSDAKKAAIEVGREAGEGLTDAMKEQLEKVAESGEIIRKYSQEGIMQLLQDEGKKNYAENIGDDKWTIGIGFTEGVKEGDYMSDEEIIERLQSELEKHQKWLNDVLDGYQELYLTQEQYDSLFNLTYQGGKGAAEQLLKRAFDESQAIEYFAKVDRKAQETLGKSLNSMIAEFNKTEEYDWVENFKGLDNVYDKISELLKIMNLTVKQGQISAELIGGMGSRSARRSVSFAGGKELSQWLTGMIEWGRDADFTSLQGVYETLSKIPVDVGNKLREEALRFMEGTKAKVGVEIDLDTSKLNLKDLKTRVQELFDGIDIFEDLSKIGFTEEEVRRIFNVEITNTDQLRRRLESMKDEFIGTKGLDEYNAFMRKINEMEDKQNVERLKRYEKYLKTMMSETAEIRIQALQDIQDVMKMEGRTSDEKAAIIEGINKEAQKKLQEQQWKQFQESDDYQLLFSDIEHLSTTTASRLKNILDELRTSLNELTPHQLRQIQAQYEKLDEQIIKHNPFDAVKKSLKEIEGLSRESDLNNTIASLTQEKMGYAENIDALDVLIDAKQKGLSIDQLDAKTQEKISGLQYLSVEELTIMRQQQQGYIDSVIAELGLTEEQLNKYKRLRKAMSEAQETWNSVMGQTRQTLSDIKGAYEALNDGAQSITLEMVDAGITLADASYQMVELLRNFKTFKKEAPGLGAALNTSLGIIGLIATAVQTIINVINMIASAHDESLEEDIKRYENQVNRLADAYDRLAEKIQKAYSFAMLATSTNQGLTNLQEQVVAYESMIEAERDKKDSDNERIQEWTDKIEELRAKMEETKKSAVQEAGGLGGEYKDAAQGFVDAWMQAFRETGNGLDALNEHFEDFLWDIASKQVLLKAADRFFAPLFEELDTRMTADTTAYDRAEKEMLNNIEKNKQAVESVVNMPYEMAKELRDSGERTFGDFGKYFDDIEKDEEKLKQIQIARQQAVQDALMLDDDDFEALKKQYEVSGKNFDDFAKNFLASLGFKGGEEGDTLSGLQKGIQGITESTAEIIESYLNSVRFFVSDSNQKLTELLERFASADDTRSPILAELRAQTSYLNSIDRALSTIIDPSGWRNGGGVLKVMM